MEEEEKIAVNNMTLAGIRGVPYVNTKSIFGLYSIRGVDLKVHNPPDSICVTESYLTS